MNNHDALLCAVCESPFDTTPRRVYADYLDDRQEATYCPTCKGSGGVESRSKIVRSRRRPPVMQKQNQNVCPTCRGKQSSYTDAERAAFIQQSCDSGINFYPARMGDRPPFQYDWPPICIIVGDGGMVWDWIGSDGFVSRVSVARIEDVLGGECYQCGGTGVSGWSNGDDGNTCLVCRGERRLPDRSALWLAHPIIDVRFTGQDAYPFAFHPGDKRTTSWLARGWNFPRVRVMWSCDLPVDLFNHMPHYGTRITETSGIAYAGSGDTPARIIEDATAIADEALSRGVVNWARHRCGLSRILWPGEPGYTQTEIEESPKSEIPKIFS